MSRGETARNDMVHKNVLSQCIKEYPPILPETLRTAETRWFTRFLIWGSWVRIPPGAPLSTTRQLGSKAIRYVAFAACLLFGAIGGSLGALEALAGEAELRESHRGITLVAVPPMPGFDYDIEIIGGRQGLDKIRDALDALLDASPYSAAAIERLGRSGEIVFIYNPHFPEKVTSGNERVRVSHGSDVCGLVR